MKLSEKIFYSFIVLIAIAAYFWNFHSVPVGFTEDAASNGLNALCLGKFGRDEYGNPFPFFIRAFDDFRPPLLIYLFAIASRFVTLDLFTMRLLSMFLGFLGTVSLFWFYKKDPDFPKPRSPLICVFSFAFLLTSSWVMVVHRMPVEFVTTLCVCVPLFFLGWRLIQKPDSLKTGALVGVFWGLLLYAYYGTKPLFFTEGLLLASFGFFKWRDGKKVNGLLTAFLIAGVFLLPTLMDLLGAGHGVSRFQKVGGSLWDIPGHLKVFWRHIDLNLFFIRGDSNFRHHTDYHGILNFVFIFGYLAGIFYSLKQKNRAQIYTLIFFGLGLIPVSLTREGIPHSLRSLPVLPAVMTLVFFGIVELEKKFKWFLIGFILLGTIEASLNVYWFQVVQPPRDKESWSMLPPYTPPSMATDKKDHSPKTIFERYYRVMAEKNWDYCNRP